jgi:hypothetical protein
LVCKKIIVYQFDSKKVINKKKHESFFSNLITKFFFKLKKLRFSSSFLRFLLCLAAMLRYFASLSLLCSEAKQTGNRRFQERRGKCEKAAKTIMKSKISKNFVFIIVFEDNNQNNLRLLQINFVFFR